MRRVRFEDPRKYSQRCSLPTAVRSDETEHLARPESEGQFFDGHAMRIPFGHVFHRDEDFADLCRRTAVLVHGLTREHSETPRTYT